MKRFITIMLTVAILIFTTAASSSRSSSSGSVGKSSSFSSSKSSSSSVSKPSSSSSSRSSSSGSVSKSSSFSKPSSSSTTKPSTTTTKPSVPSTSTSSKPSATTTKPSSTSSRGSSAGTVSKSVDFSKTATSNAPAPKIDSTSSNLFSSTPKAVATAKPMSAADKATLERSKIKGTTFTSRDAAINDFKTKNASTYTNNFASEPATRPSYIPSTTVVGGNTYNVTYRNGNYGYYGPSGNWIMYNTIADVAMLSLLMDHDSHYRTNGNTVVYVENDNGTVVARRGHPVLITFLLLGFAAIIIVAIVYSRKG